MSLAGTIRLALALALAGVFPLGAQQTELPSRLQAATRSEIVRLADSLRASGLPADPLYAKAAEGVLKNADDARILIAVRRLARTLGESRQALGAGATEPALVAGASALNAGATAAQLRRFIRTPSPGANASQAQALVVLADLLARGVPGDTATSTVATLYERGVRAEDYDVLRRRIESEILNGRTPGSATALQGRLLMEEWSTRPRPRQIPPPVRDPDA